VLLQIWKIEFVPVMHDKPSRKIKLVQFSWKLHTHLKVKFFFVLSESLLFQSIQEKSKTFL